MKLIAFELYIHNIEIRNDFPDETFMCLHVFLLEMYKIILLKAVQLSQISIPAKYKLWLYLLLARSRSSSASNLRHSIRKCIDELLISVLCRDLYLSLRIFSGRDRWPWIQVLSN